METLPVVVIRNIVKFLYIEDVIACCATSTSWRVKFNQDHVWRPFCNQRLAAYLKVTDCRVEPGFVSPEPEDGLAPNLSPICEWRLNYMREVHLWNNWSLRRGIEEYIGPVRCEQFEDKYELFQFINSNRLLIKLKQEKKVMLWDVKESPLHLYDPVTLEFDDCVELCRIIQDKIIFLQQNKIQIYKMNDTTTVAWEVQGVYNLSFNVRSAFIMSNVLVALNFPILNRNRENMLEIFDLDKNETVKTAKSPREGIGHFTNCLNIFKGEKYSMHFTLLLKEADDSYEEADDSEEEIDSSEDELFDMFIYIYSIEKMGFVNFSITVTSPFNWLPHLYCCVDKEYLVVFNHGSIQIYRYLTSELLLDAPGRFILAEKIFSFRNHSFSMYFRDDLLEGDEVIINENYRFVLIDTQYSESGILPVDFHSLRHQAYSIAKLLAHFRENTALPTEMIGVGLLTRSYYVCDTYTKSISKGPKIVTLW